MKNLLKRRIDTSPLYRELAPTWRNRKLYSASKELRLPVDIKVNRHTVHEVPEGAILGPKKGEEINLYILIYISRYILKRNHKKASDSL